MRQVFLFMVLCLLSCAKDPVILEQEEETKEEAAQVSILARSQLQNTLQQTGFSGHVSIHYGPNGWHLTQAFYSPVSIQDIPSTYLAQNVLGNGDTRFYVLFDLWDSSVPDVQYLIDVFSEGSSNPCWFSVNSCETIAEHSKSWYIHSDEDYFVGVLDFEPEGVDCFLETDAWLHIPAKWVFD